MLLRGLVLTVVLALAAPLVPGLASSAQAQRNPLIQQGAEQYDDLRFEEALQTLSAALIRSGNSDAERVQIYRFLAFTYLALGREEEAAGAYRSLLVIEPEHEVGTNASPRTREFFAQVKQQWDADGRPGMAQAGTSPDPIEIQHRSPAQAERGEPIELRASIDGPSGSLSRIVLAYRQGTNDVFQRIEAELVAGEFVATIPGEDVRPPLVEYYFEGLDALGLPVAARGDVAAPLRVAVPAPGGSVLTKWWFWTIVGVAVAGAVTTGVVLANSGDGPAPIEQGTLIITVR